MCDQDKGSEPEALRVQGAPGAMAVATDVESGVGRGFAYLAGLFGAWFFTPLLWLPIQALAFRRGRGGLGDFMMIYLGLVAVSALALAPFGIAVVRAKRVLRKRAMIAAVHGAIVGLALCIPFFSGSFNLLGCMVWLAPGVLGPVFGLLALASCWRRGDPPCRALALLGIAPAVFIALWGIGSAIERGTAPQEVAKTYPAKIVKPPPSSAAPTR
jgi:hypothetical protein